MRVKRHVFRQHFRTLLLIIGTALIVFYCLMPFYWVLSVSITPEQKFYARDVRFIPAEVTLANYGNLFDVLPFERYFLNSTIVASTTVAFSLLLAIPAAYSFARFRFRGRHLLIRSLLLLYMIPTVVLLVPLLIILKTLGMINTYRGLILAEASNTIPFAIWLLIGFFMALPRELEEAALVDGCTPLGALIRVVLPLSLPGIVAAGIFIFIAAWNHFMYAFMFASGEEIKTLPVVLRYFIRGESGIFWGTIMASATITTLPVFAVFMFFQKYLIGGMTAGSVKG